MWPNPKVAAVDGAVANLWRELAGAVRPVHQLDMASIYRLSHTHAGLLEITIHVDGAPPGWRSAVHPGRAHVRPSRPCTPGLAPGAARRLTLRRARGTRGSGRGGWQRRPSAAAPSTRRWRRPAGPARRRSPAAVTGE
jgi:hypothetical protein